VWDADCARLMQLGSLASIAGAAPRNLVHFLFKNGVYHTSGAQGIPGGLSVDFVTMAKGAGYRTRFGLHVPEIVRVEGTVFVELHTGLAEQTPMTARGGVPFPQQVTELRAKLL